MYLHKRALTNNQYPWSRPPNLSITLVELTLQDATKHRGVSSDLINLHLLLVSKKISQQQQTQFNILYKV